MRELKIKFSKKYRKLPENANGRKAILLDVHNIRLQYQEPAFLEYDTTARDGSKYKLPDTGEYILLLFELVDGGVFTTIRSWSGEKEKYFREAKGKFFEVVVE